MHEKKKPANSSIGHSSAPVAHEVALVIVSQQFEQETLYCTATETHSEIHGLYNALQYSLLQWQGWILHCSASVQPQHYIVPEEVCHEKKNATLLHHSQARGDQLYYVFLFPLQSIFD